MSLLRSVRVVLVASSLLALPLAAAEMTRQAAEAQALKDVAGGKILSIEREVENGRDVWSLDVRTADGKHVMEVQYLASTGAFVAKKEETPKEQAREKAAEASPASPVSGAVARFTVGGDGGWDYLVVDAPSRRLFVSRSTHVMVVDADSGKVVGNIPETEGVHGIALAPELKRGFTSNGRSSTVSIFDLETLAVISRVKTTGDNPDAILFEPFTKRVFTFNGRGKNTTAIDAASGAVAGTIALGGKPEFAASDGKGRVFVNIEDTNEIVVLDPAKLTAEARWPLAPCEEPTGMALDVKKQRLFVGCGNRLLMVVNVKDGHIVAKLPIGDGNDAVALDVEKGLVLASNGEGTLTIVKETAPDVYGIIQTVATQKSARTLALDPKTHHVFLPAAKFGAPPAATVENPRPRPSMVPGSFEILVVGTP
ncbi:MAG: YncE family protein [Thermoanaerobaculia bacterium]